MILKILTTLCILIFLLLLLFLFCYVMKRISEVKCKYADVCKNYDSSSFVCNKDGGMYYGWNRPAGCYIQMEEKFNKKWKNNAKF